MTEKPKIIVDEDWKSQVEREREAWKQQGEGASLPPAQSGEAEESPPIPPASFAMLATSIATQALFALGALVTDRDEKPVVNLELARHHIDSLGLLEEKTKGNLTAEESSLLAQWLSELRMAYVAARQESHDGP